MVTCSEKTLIAASMIFGGLTFLLPSAITIFMYITKWVPEETDPAQQQKMKWVLAGSVIAGTFVVAGGVYYLQKEGCI